MRRTRLLPMLPLAMCLWAAPAHAEFDPEFQLWTALFLDTNRNDPGLALWLDLHARRAEGGAVGIIRPGVGYRFDRSWVVHAGYAWTPVAPDGGEVEHRHQMWQQVLWTPAMPKPWAMAWRVRLEERFSTAGSDVALRGRFFGRGAYAIADTPLFFVVWDELLLNLSDADWGPQVGLGENRLFVGAGLSSPDGFRVELGYLNIILRRPATLDAAQHNIALNIFASFL